MRLFWESTIPGIYLIFSRGGCRRVLPNANSARDSHELRVLGRKRPISQFRKFRRQKHVAREVPWWPKGNFANDSGETWASIPIYHRDPTHFANSIASLTNRVSLCHWRWCDANPSWQPKSEESKWEAKKRGSFLLEELPRINEILSG